MLGARDRKQVYGHFMRFLALVTRVRQSCCHGSLVPPEAVGLAQEVLKELEEGELTGTDGTLDLDSDEGKELLNKILSCLSPSDDDDTEHFDSNCAVCFNELEGDTACVLKTCKHVLCGDCLQEINEHGNSHCPMCRQNFRKSDIIKKSVAEAAGTYGIVGAFRVVSFRIAALLLHQLAKNSVQIHEFHSSCLRRIFQPRRQPPRTTKRRKRSSPRKRRNLSRAPTKCIPRKRPFWTKSAR